MSLTVSVGKTLASSPSLALTEAEENAGTSCLPVTLMVNWAVVALYLDLSTGVMVAVIVADSPLLTEVSVLPSAETLTAFVLLEA